MMATKVLFMVYNYIDNDEMIDCAYWFKTKKEAIKKTESEEK
jgi:hypothetical protein